MRALFIGDIVGGGGLDYIVSSLSGLRTENKIDFVIVNGENVSDHNGITKKDAETLRYAGVDVITTGNHAFRQKSIFEMMDESNYIIRPCNLPPSAVGNGYTEINTAFGKVGVLNLIGQLFIGYPDNPFVCADRILEKMSSCNYIFVDFHAEATSEKRAIGFYLDGRVSGVFGTHTHVQTADEQILEKGTAYITDVGMTGGRNSILGVKKEGPMQKFSTTMPASFEQDNVDIVLNAVVFDTETKEIYRINTL